MKNNYQEDVGMIVGQIGQDGQIKTGPIVRRSYTPFEFSIRFTEGSKEWLLNPQKIVNYTYPTSGEWNRAFLHKALDRHIDDFIQGTRTAAVE